AASMKAAPSADSRTWRGVRSSSRRPNWSSSRRSFRLIADCVLCIASAARVKLCSSAVRTKALTASRSRDFMAHLCHFKMTEIYIHMFSKWMIAHTLRRTSSIEAANLALAGFQPPSEQVLAHALALARSADTARPCRRFASHAPMGRSVCMESTAEHRKDECIRQQHGRFGTTLQDTQL